MDAGGRGAPGEERGGRPPRVGAEIAGTEETYEALVAGLGVRLVASGNAPLITLGGVVTLPVRGLGPSRYTLAWRREDGGEGGPGRSRTGPVRPVRLSVRFTRWS